MSLIKLFTESSNTRRNVIIKQYENKVWWIHDAETDEQLDGDKRKRVIQDMAKRWGYKILKWIPYNG